MVELYIVKLPKKIDEKIYDELLDALDNESSSRIKRFRFIEDSYRTLLAKMMAEYLLCKKLNVGRSKLKFIKNTYGKPYLENSNIYFNNSHSGDFIMSGISDCELGVDVEKIKKIDIDVAKRFFNKHEYSIIKKGNSDEQKNKFFDFWTLKESFIKADGRGMSIPLKSFQIIENEKSITVKINEKDTTYTLKQYSMHPEYKAAACIKDGQLPDEFVKVGADNLITEYMKIVDS